MGPLSTFDSSTKGPLGKKTLDLSHSQKDIPGGGHGNPLQYSCLENLHEQKSFVGYSPWGHKESDMTEQLRTHIDDIK